MKEGAPPAELTRKLSVLALVRTAYSSERVVMAWMRTSVSLYTFGFSITKFMDYDKVSGEPRTVGVYRF